MHLSTESQAGVRGSCAPKQKQASPEITKEKKPFVLLIYAVACLQSQTEAMESSGMVVGKTGSTVK